MKSTYFVQKVQSDKDTQFIEGWHLMRPGQVLQVNLEQKLIVGYTLDWFGQKLVN